MALNAVPPGVVIPIFPVTAPVGTVAVTWMSDLTVNAADFPPKVTFVACVRSGVAGLLMQVFSFSAPLLVGGGTKVLYDVLLFSSFRKLKPPEENVRPNPVANIGP